MTAVRSTSSASGLMLRGAASTTKRARKGPICTMSPGSSVCSLARAPLTKTPLRLPRSLTVTVLPDGHELRVPPRQQRIVVADLARRIAADDDASDQVKFALAGAVAEDEFLGHSVYINCCAASGVRARTTACGADADDAVEHPVLHRRKCRPFGVVEALQRLESRIRGRPVKQRANRYRQMPESGSAMRLSASSHDASISGDRQATATGAALFDQGRELPVTVPCRHPSRALYWQRSMRRTCSMSARMSAHCW